MSANFLVDAPATQPRFDYPLIAKALLPLLTQTAEAAVVVGIHGAWGSGKTTLVREIRRQVEASEAERGAILVDFNAWKYQDREALWRALILQMLAALRNAGGDAARIAELERSLYQAFVIQEKGPWRVNWSAVLVEVLSLALQVLKLDFVAAPLKASFGWLGKLLGGGAKDGKESGLDSKQIERLASVLERSTVDRQVQQVQSIEQFLDKFSGLVGDLTKSGRHVYVFIDDVDRCLPDSALQIFEAIKLFLDAPGCSYTVAVDREVISKGLFMKYGNQGSADGRGFIDPDEYIEKTISLSFDLPRLTSVDAMSLMGDIQLPVTLTNPDLELIAVGAGVNPRRVKRFMNSLAVQLELARLVKDQGVPVFDWVTDAVDRSPFSRFLKFALIAYHSSGLMALAIQDVRLLARLQEVANTYANAVAAGKIADARQTRVDRLKDEVQLVRGLAEDEPFWQLMSAGPSMADDLQQLALLTSWFRAHASAPASPSP